MADNYEAKDAGGTNVSFDSKDIGSGIQRPRVEIGSAPAGALTDIGNSTSTTGIITDTAGTVLGFLRGIVVLLLRFTASIGQKLKATSLAVVLASDSDPLQLTAGAESIGGVKDNGPFYVPTQTLGSSANASSTPVDITTLPVNSAKAVILDDLVFSAAVDMVITVKEASGADLLVSLYKTAMGPCSISPRNRLRAAVNKKMQILTSVSGQIYTWASWHEE
jgi:hypothetical protein